MIYKSHLEGDPARFGRIIQTERKRRGLTREKVQEKVGLGVMTQYNVENAKGGTPRAQTFTAYEELFGWKEESAARTFYGGDPKPLHTDVVPEPVPELPPAVRKIAFRLAQLNDPALKQVEELLDLADKMRESNNKGE
ncbi:hypothetical protein ACL02S_15055 [Nocardia sp. 004]|uniref:hypothetical protein n=1 Tax=Nocardia sp. 004 TaxID=3385978 RepID=UPI0039A28353